MKLDIDFNGKEQSTSLTYFVDQFKGERDFAVALSILETFAADFDMAPEIEKEDLMDILERVKELEKEQFKVIISEDDIEVDLES